MSTSLFFMVYSDDTRVTGPLVQADPLSSDHGSISDESEDEDETWLVIT